MTRQPRQLITRKLAISGLSGRKVLDRRRVHVGNVYWQDTARKWRWVVLAERGHGFIADGEARSRRDAETCIHLWIEMNRPQSLAA